ncbi:hypothetical protein PG991_013346 [Apiospora marii]|uniref:WW domain-containing protein n=1 Tax=Apiospora marii TaxID=335849 RepID=A0ABR1R7L9_9PEZI
MSALPEGWEWDYDGTRWLYRYKPTGLVQYHFPKPGDEFPEYVGFGIGSFDLEPEERLASDMQMKRRDTQSGTQDGAVSSSSQRKKKQTAEIDEIGATGYFDPEGFMYLGPGGYGDTSHEEEERDGPMEMENTSVDKQRHSNATQAKGQEPLPLVSQPSGGLSDVPTPGSAVSTHVAPNQFFAELATHDTQKCADELAPIELDAAESSTRTILAELSSEGPSGSHTEKSSIRASNNHSSPPAPVQPIDAHPQMYASFSFRPLDKDQASDQSPNDWSDTNVGNTQHSSITPSSQESTPFQAWRPGTKPDTGEASKPKRSSLAPSGSSLMEFQNSELSHLDQRRYSFPAKVPNSAINRHPTILTPSAAPRSSSRDRPYSTTELPHSPIPTVLRPATRSESPLSQSHQENTPPSSNPDTTPLGDTDLTHCPSVLKPAKSRYSRPHASTISGNITTAPGLKPAAQSSPLGKSGDLHHTPTQEHHDKDEPPLRMPDFPDYDDRPLPHRVNTMPDQLPSQSQGPSPKIAGLGPGFYVFHEIKPGKDPLESDATQVTEAQELSATERPVELSSDPVVSTNGSVAQNAPGHDQQDQVTSEYGNSLGNTTAHDVHGQTSSNDATSNQPQSSPFSHNNETDHFTTQSAASNPPEPVAATTSQEQTTVPANQDSYSSDSTSGSVVKPNQSSQSNHIATTCHADSASNGAPSGFAAAGLIPDFATPQQKPAMPSSQPSNTANHPLSAPVDGPGCQFEVPLPILSAPQDHGTIQGLHSTTPPPIPPLPAKPQHAHAQASSTMNTERPPTLNQGKPPQYYSTQQVQRPPHSPQKPDVAGNLNGLPHQGQHPSPVQQPAVGIPNNLPMRPTSEYSQYPSPMTSPASLAHSQVSSPAASIASLSQPPPLSSALNYSSFHSIFSPGHTSPGTPAQTPMHSQHTSSPARPPVTHAQIAPPAPLFSPQQPTTAHRPPGGHQMGGIPHNQSIGVSTGPGGNSSLPSQTQQMMHRPPQAIQTPPALMPSGGSYPMPTKPQQIPGTGVAGQTTAQMPTSQPVQQQQQQHQQYQQPPQQQSAQPIVQQLGNIQGQGHAHTHTPQGQAMPSPTSTHPLRPQQLGYGHQSPTAAPQSASSPVNGLPSQQPQVPSNGNPAASLSNVGQDVKKWAKKMWKSPAFQQTTTAIGGALLAESMGGDGVAGAMAANQIYNTSQTQQQVQQQGQPQGLQQGQQPPRPQRPPHVHAQTAPPQIQRPPGPHPSIQQVHQPVSNVQPGGMQMPGRPYAVQNPTIQSVPMQMQQRPPGQAPMMNPPAQGQQGQYAVSQPPPQTQGQYIASQPSLYSPPPEQTIINQQQTINQTFTMNTESNNVSAGNGSVAAYSQQPAVVQNNQVIVDNSAASGTYFAQPPAATPLASNDINITNINIEANANNTQYTYLDSSATYYDNSTATATTTATSDVFGVINSAAVTDYSATATAEYSAAAADYNNVAATNVDCQMGTMYMATDDVSTMYIAESVDASAAVATDGWAAAASVTVDYSGRGLG